MLAALVDSTLPGARNLRAPLISGLLWALILWYHLSGWIPSEESATGWTAQIYTVIDTLGPFSLALVASVLLFVLGAATSAATELLGKNGARLVATLRTNLIWQYNARRGWRALKRSLREVESQMELQEKRKRSDSLDNLNKMKADKEAQLAGLAAKSWQERIWKPRNENWINLTRPRSLYSDYSLVEEAVQRLIFQAVTNTIQRFGAPIGATEVISKQYQGTNVGTLARSIVQELRDPVEALQALDSELYLIFDRRRAEREVRVSISLPLTVASLIISQQTGNLWWLLAAVAGVAMLISYSINREGEFREIFSGIALKGLHTPVMNQATSVGEDMARSFMASRTDLQDLFRNAQKPQ